MGKRRPKARDSRSSALLVLRLNDIGVTFGLPSQYLTNAIKSLIVSMGHKLLVE